MLKTLIPPPVYALLFAVAMGVLDRYLPVYEWLSAPWNKLGWLVIGGGVCLDLTALWLFYRAKTTPNPLRPERASQLVISGLYRYTRNPMYVGLLLMLSGWAFYLGSLSPWLLLPLFVQIINWQQILPEEHSLSTKFGQAYQDYQQQVPRWLW